MNATLTNSRTAVLDGLLETEATHDALRVGRMTLAILLRIGGIITTASPFGILGVVAVFFTNFFAAKLLAGSLGRDSWSFREYSSEYIEFIVNWKSRKLASAIVGTVVGINVIIFIACVFVLGQPFAAYGWQMVGSVGAGMLLSFVTWRSLGLYIDGDKKQKEIEEKKRKTFIRFITSPLIGLPADAAQAISFNYDERGVIEVANPHAELLSEKSQSALKNYMDRKGYEITKADSTLLQIAPAIPGEDHDGITIEVPEEEATRKVVAEDIDYGFAEWMASK